MSIPSCTFSKKLANLHVIRLRYLLTKILLTKYEMTKYKEWNYYDLFLVTLCHIKHIVAVVVLATFAANESDIHTLKLVKDDRFSTLIFNLYVT